MSSRVLRRKGRSRRAAYAALGWAVWHGGRRSTPYLVWLLRRRAGIVQRPARLGALVIAAVALGLVAGIGLAALRRSAATDVP